MALMLVQTLQQRLFQYNYYMGEVDNEPGPLTSAAVIAFKKANGLTPRDYVGPITMTKLFDGSAKAADPVGSTTAGASKAPWLEYMLNYVGLKEVPGPTHNPTIVQWGKDAGITWWNNDEDAWCAVAVNGALVNTGYPSTKSALARSFVNYGRKLNKVKAGAIVVFPRGSNPTYGHVGVVSEVLSNGMIKIVSGNVSNMQKISTRYVSEILDGGIRWPVEVK